MLLFVPSSGAVSGGADPTADWPDPPARCLLPSGAISPHLRPCRVNRFRPNRPTVVLWGDSHAIQMMPAVEKAIRGRGVNFAMFALGACPPQKFGRSRDLCKSFNADALRYVTKLQRRGKPVRVILGANWHGYLQLHRELFVTKTVDPADVTDWVVEVARVFPRRAPGLIRRLGRLGVDVDVIAQTATVPEKRPRCAAGETPYVCDLPRHRALPHERRTRSWLRAAMRPLGRGARLIDLNRAYCNTRVCRGKKRGIYTYFNDLHISATRAKTMKRFFVPTITRLNRSR